MADDGSAQGSVWPLPKFYFEVEISDLGKTGFQTCEGLNQEVSVVEYRHGNSPNHHKIKMPGMKKYGNITLKKGVFKDDTIFLDWFAEIKLNTIKRRTITIKLLDEAGAPAMTWTLINAFPSKVTPTGLNSEEESAPAIEEVEVVYESFSKT